ncbi:MerR family transcriptional regulator [Magnetococcus sp. PR-3]|uniref:MerR family transcriptional regulator n=1 Tax=Magnetococcus sp. PR-3 TaxID=3120355 RepID=UPI002FCE1C5F
MAHTIPIRMIAESLNTSTDTVRTWERRYGLFSPVRLHTGGHRRYSQTDLEQAQQLRLLLDKGMRISKAVKVLHMSEDAHGGPQTSRHFYQALIRAIQHFDLLELDRVYQKALTQYHPDTVMKKLIVPVFQHLGQNWDKHPGGIAEEHFASHFLYSKLSTRLNQTVIAGRSFHLLAACLPGEQHELGLLLFCLTIVEEGFYPIYLGPNLPISQFNSVISQSGCQGIVLSGKSAFKQKEVLDQLYQVSEQLSVPIFIGGEVAANHAPLLRQHGVIPLEEDFSKALTTLSTHIPQPTTI